MGRRLKHDYDDGYLMLAYWVVSHNTLPRIKQALVDDNWLRVRVREDCLNLDLAGPFLDAIIQDLTAEEKLWLRARLKVLGDDLFAHLDKKRLRDNIAKIIHNP